MIDPTLTIAICAAGLWLLIAGFIHKKSVRILDEKLLACFQDHIAQPLRARSKKIDTAMRDLTALGGDMFSAIVLISGSILLASSYRFYELPVFLCLILSTRLVGLIAKKTIRRARPPISGQATDVFTSSFPSIHTAMSFVSSFAVAAILLPYVIAWPFALVFAGTISALVGFTRLYFSVHWPLDVAAGWLLGLASCLVVILFLLS